MDTFLKWGESDVHDSSLSKINSKFFRNVHRGGLYLWLLPLGKILLSV